MRVSESERTDPRSTKFILKAGLKNRKLCLKSSREWHSPEGYEDADRLLDFNSVRHFPPQFWLAPRPRKGVTSCWGNRLPDSLLRYLDAIPHGLHGIRLGSWLEAKNLVAWRDLGIQDWQEVPSAHCLSIAPSAAAFCIWPKDSIANHFRGLLGLLQARLGKSQIWHLAAVLDVKRSNLG